MPWAAAFALAAGVSFAGAAIFLRRALQWVEPATAAVLSVSFTAAFVWIVAASTIPLGRVWAPEIVFFLAAGLFAPGLARLVYYTALTRVGVARATALMSTSPLFAVLLAILMLGERPAVSVLVGVAFVVAGGALLAHRGRDDRTWRRRDLVLPLAAALGFALRDIISRRGLLSYPEPMVAAAGVTLASVALMWLLVLAGVMKIRMAPPAGLGFLALSSLCESLAYLTMWRALAIAPVSVVSPLVHSQPLFTILLAMVFLRDVERMTWRVVLASALIVAGVTFVLRVT